MSTDGSRLEGTPLEGDRVLQAVLAIVAVALFARFVALGWRVAHFDEGRVAYWVLHWLQDGEFHYRYIIHGPFIQHVDRVLFGLFGPSDFVSRLPVALVGGLLPLVALAFRDRLTRYETVGFAAFLAVDPILLYYGRFMRSTVLVAAFSLVAFAAFVAWYDGKGARYFYAGVAVLALAFAAKENAILYVIAWLGAGVLVFDHKFFRPGSGRSGWDRLKAEGRGVGERARDEYGSVPVGLAAWAGHAVLAALLFGVLILYFYAPRGGGGGAAVGFWQAVGNPALFPELVSITVDDIVTGYGYWFSNPTTESVQAFVDTFLERFGRFVGTSLFYSGPLFLLAVAGFLYERYLRVEPRQFVMFASYWGFASVVGYPLGTDIWGAWIIVNALIPLAIPAAVVVGVFLESGWASFRADDTVGVRLAALVVILLVGQVAVVGANSVYLNPTSDENDLVQFAQPAQEMRPALRASSDAIAASGDGPDVLFYGGSDFVDMDETAVRKPACIRWFNTLPWSWYLAQDGASVTCANSSEQLPRSLPPVIVAEGDCTLDRKVDCRERPEAVQADGDLRQRVPDSYDRYAFLHRTTGGSYFDGMVVYVRRGG